MTMENVVLLWSEDPTGNYGDGVSRPKPHAKTREYQVMVFPPNAMPMRWITKAESKRHAIRYAQARWPGAEVEVA